SGRGSEVNVALAISSAGSLSSSSAWARWASSRSLDLHSFAQWPFFPQYLHLSDFLGWPVPSPTPGAWRTLLLARPRPRDPPPRLFPAPPLELPFSPGPPPILSFAIHSSCVRRSRPWLSTTGGGLRRCSTARRRPVTSSTEMVLRSRRVSMEIATWERSSGTT